MGLFQDYQPDALQTPLSANIVTNPLSSRIRPIFDESLALWKEEQGLVALCLAFVASGSGTGGLAINEIAYTDD